MSSATRCKPSPPAHQDAVSPSLQAADVGLEIVARRAGHRASGADRDARVGQHQGWVSLAVVMTHGGSRVAVVIAILALPRVAGAQFFSPGALARPHTSLEGLEKCSKCHEEQKGLSAKLCLDCHTELRDAGGEGRWLSRATATGQTSGVSGVPSRSPRSGVFDGGMGRRARPVRTSEDRVASEGRARQGQVRRLSPTAPYRRGADSAHVGQAAQTRDLAWRWPGATPATSTSTGVS